MRVGTVFCGITGLSLLLSKPEKDGPYGVTISTGGFWESEYLSTANERWAEALANAIQEAMRQGRDPGGEGFIPGQDRLRN